MALTSLHLNSIGRVYGAGYNAVGCIGNGTSNTTNEYSFSTSPVVEIGAFTYHAIAFDGGGSLRGWGYNTYGQVGDGTTADRFSPIAIDHPFTTGVARGCTAYSSAARSSKPIMMSSVKLSLATVKGGTSLTGTATLTSVAGAGGLTIILSSNIAAATVPASALIPAGAKTVNFAITTKAVGAPVKATISATRVNTVTAALTINP